MMGLASFLISIPAILLLWMSFSSNKPYECKWGEGERQKRGEEGGGGVGQKGGEGERWRIGKERMSKLSQTQEYSKLRESYRWTDQQYLSVLKDKEPHVLPVVHLILTEDGRSKVLDPHTRQLVTVDVVVLKTTLHWEGEVRGKVISHEGWLQQPSFKLQHL